MTDHVVDILVRVNYSETDRMGVAYHGRYPVWFDMARTEYLRRTGVSYRELEDSGLLLAVTTLSVRFIRSAEYDDPVRIRCWVSDLGSRRVTFGYVVEHAERGDRFATGETSLVPMDRDHRVTRFPPDVAARLVPVTSPAPAP